MQRLKRKELKKAPLRTQSSLSAVYTTKRRKRLNLQLDSNLLTTMRFGSMLYYLIVATAKVNDTIATKQGLEDITYRAIETNQNGVDIVPVKALNLEGDKCCVISSVTCMVDTGRTGEDCNDYVVPMNECNTEELMNFNFKYCNNEDTFLKFHTQEFMALVEMSPVSGFDLTDLPSKECRYFTVRSIRVRDSSVPP
jgi:hypothetical protein